MIGENPASQIYVKSKTKFFLKNNCKSETFEFNSNISENEILDLIEKLNNDRTMTIQKINQFESELVNLKNHLSMISGAIQTCTYFLTGKEKSENEEVVSN